DGVHLPFDSIGAGAARKLLGPARLIGVSTHSEPDVVAASREGHADFAVFGPVYEPLSKRAYGKAQGPQALFDICKSASLPIFALGGITPERATQLLARSGSDSLAGVAAIGSIMSAESPASAMREM